ncbi:hypothetical protein Ptr902_08821 [Pyrenophora tritici-repentis]|nr:hypothetical protein Alg130_02251 [Pyrenophora tritici-repentis]KAI0614384.1 hypothetical protein TUN205_01345 [Pyrenophora tritici-repentis]KAI0627801.1 hypothetical protein TUN199_00140 [Pyrenophora tritici-repentis]KAI1664767.1 hypothetical protein L13192_10886 [Pyrenophora tritici-repentis]KAI1689871.1 hypothetical protein KJE20_03049 [Pyrenophora tritici-repentis]
MYTNQSPATASAQDATFSRLTTALTSVVTTSFTHVYNIAPASFTPRRITPNPFFPQATNPVWVPSESEVPVEWQPQIEKDEENHMFKFWIFVIALFGMVVLIPLLCGLWWMLSAGCRSKPKYKAARSETNWEREMDEEEERKFSGRARGGGFRWFG